MSCLCTISDIRSGNACAECMNPPSVPFTGRQITVNLTDIARDDFPERLAWQSVGKLDAAVFNELESHMTETPLEKLIETLYDTSDLTDAEVREELVKQGIDLDAAKARFTPKLDELMRARAVRQALAAVRDNPLPQHSPLPWFSRKWTIRSAKGIVGDLLTDEDAACIAAAVNSAPLLAAEVERSHGNLLTQAKRAGLPVEQLQATDLAEHLADRVLELQRLPPQRPIPTTPIRVGPPMPMPPDNCASVVERELRAEVERLQGVLSAARVAVEKARMFVECFVSPDGQRDKLSTFKVDIPANGYPRQWACDAAPAVLAEIDGVLARRAVGLEG